LCKIDLYEDDEEEESSISSNEEEDDDEQESNPNEITPSTTHRPIYEAWWNVALLGRWLASRSSRRRPTMEGGMLTELTEPLINNTNEEEGGIETPHPSVPQHTAPREDAETIQQQQQTETSTTTSEPIVEV
jgi:hypothetical protein